MSDNQPQGFFIPPQVSATTTLFKLLFNLKTLSIVTILVLSIAVYVQQNRIDYYKLQFDNQVAKTALVDRDLTYCRSNFEQLTETVENAAKESQKMNEEFFDLKSQIEKFNKVNRNNSKQIEDIRNSAVANTCDDAMKELVSSIEDSK